MTVQSLIKIVEVHTYKITKKETSASWEDKVNQ